MDIHLPNLGEGADSGVVVNILVKEGDRVTKNQTIFELENEKAVAPIPTPVDGVIQKIHVQAGQKISVGQLIASIESEGAPATMPTKATPVAAEPHEPATHETKEEFHYASKSGLPPPASPTVRLLARQLGIDLEVVRGSGEGGRVLVDDLKNYVQTLQNVTREYRERERGSGKVKQAAPSIDFAKWGPITKKPLSALRQTISRHMEEAWNTIPHVTQHAEADITELLKIRKAWLPKYEENGARLTVSAFLVQCAVRVLKKFPVFNASLDETKMELVEKQYYRIGIAVDTEAGLIVPVIKEADKIDLLTISKSLEDLAQKARDRKLSTDELSGGTFTLSNVGGIGGSFFTPIIHKPEVAILGVGQTVEKPVYVKGELQKRSMMPLSLSYDHRVIDGAEGTRFIKEFVNELESYHE